MRGLNMVICALRNNSRIWICVVFTLLFNANVNANANANAIQLELLNTARLDIRPMESRDTKSFVEMYSNAELMKQANTWVSSTGVLEKQAQDIIHGNNRMKAGDGIRSIKDLGFAVIERATGVTIGFLVFYREVRAPYFESNTVIDKLHQSRGFGKEARASVIRFLFEQMGAEGLISRISSNNKFSLQLTESLGFPRIREIQDRRNRQELPSVEFRLSKLRWEKGVDEHANIFESLNLRPALRDILDLLYMNDELPYWSKVALNYQYLIKEPQLVNSIGPENLSLIAEVLAKQGEQDFSLAMDLTMSIVRASVRDVWLNHPRAQIFEIPDVSRYIVVDSLNPAKHSTILHVSASGETKMPKVRNENPEMSGTTYSLEGGLTLQIPSPVSMSSEFAQGELIRLRRVSHAARMPISCSKAGFSPAK
ncbi:MAG: hypothetical protein C5B49_09175 [Bdellovibrio sp.]|nr:MAG: hypothetical protein C5B49_09175 [Bdellovibrio sp.]